MEVGDYNPVIGVVVMQQVVGMLALASLRQHDQKEGEHCVANGLVGRHVGQLAVMIMKTVVTNDYQA